MNEHPTNPIKQSASLSIIPILLETWTHYPSLFSNQWIILEENFPFFSTSYFLNFESASQYKKNINC